MKKRNFILGIILAAVLLTAGAGTARAAGTAEDTARFTRGFGRVFTGIFQLPYHLFNSSFTRPPIVGTLEGAFKGTFYTLTNVVGGVFDMGAAAAPYAKYALFAA